MAEITLLRHQQALINMVRLHPEIPYTFLIGGFSCLTGQSKIRMADGSEVPLCQFEGGDIKTPQGTRTVAMPIPRWMQVVDVSGDGWQIRCSDVHRFRSSDGKWISCRELLERLLAHRFFRILQWTSEECAPPVQPADALRWMRTTQDLILSYFSYYRLGDAQLRLLEEASRDGFPLPEHVLARTMSVLQADDVPADDLRILSQCIRLYSLLYRLSTGRSILRNNSLSSRELLSDEIYVCGLTHCAHFCSAFLQSRCSISLEISAPLAPDSIFQISALLPPASIIREDGSETTVKKVLFAGVDKCYHLTVPEEECYYADGLLHHNCGKSFTDVSFMLFLVEQYYKYPQGATFGLIGASIKLLTQTVLKDFIQYCTISSIPFKDNSQKGFIQVGNVRFVYLSGADPADIYAHNFMGAICDELDELPPERILALIKAIQERVRVRVPASTLMPERSPFVVFTTTAQGLGGTYQLIQYLKKIGLKHAIIRARTADNPHNDPIMIENLTKLYTPEERDAFLEGKFVNLSAGRVYPVFDRKKHVYMPFEVRPGDKVYVGADFNYGFDNTSALIERAGTIYVVSEHRLTFMGDAPKVLREAYPDSEIEFVPDASGKEVMQGLTEEFESARVAVFWNSVNPGIAERVTAVNRLLAQGRLKVFSTCERVALGLEIQDYDDAGKPRKGKGPEAVDHILDCLSYAVWRIIHQIHGYDDILDAIRAVHHHSELLSA